MNQTNHFFDLGYGWLCKHCSAADTEASQDALKHPKDSSQKREAGLPLATWADPSRQTLTCPRCGISEEVARAGRMQ